MQRKLMIRTLAAAGIISLGLGGYGIAHYPMVREATAATVPAAASTKAAGTVLADFAGIVANAGPAVVNISVTGREQTADQTPRMPDIDPDNPLYEFFRHFQIPLPQGGAPTRGMGSGFIVSSDGVVLTNAHVVGDASDIRVKLTDRREFKAKVLGVDRPSDVAVLKIDARDLPAVTLDAADDVQVGQWVLAIGSPFGFENSASSGIVSAKYRSLGPDTYVPFIQTDVAVNPGNSGGPLFNTSGEVIGINSQIYSRSGGYQGLSFAIPISVAMHIKDQIMQHGKVTRGRLGVMVQEVNQPLAESFGLKSTAGALVSSVEKGGPAAAAGLEPGDVILRFNDKPISSSSQLPLLVAETAPGTRAALSVERRGSPRQIEVTVGEFKSKGENATLASTAERHGRLGVAVRPLTKAERAESDPNGGLLVESVSGAAARAGIQPGDVILSLNSTPVKSTDQLKALISDAGKHVAVRVRRDDATLFIPIDLG